MQPLSGPQGYQIHHPFLVSRKCKLGKYEVKQEFFYLPDCPAALMGRDLCKRRAQKTFDSDSMAALKLRGPEAKILTLMVEQEGEWQHCASKKEIPKMLLLPFKIPGVWAEDNPTLNPRLALNMPSMVVELKLVAIPVSQRLLYSLKSPNWDPKAS
jgi:hypothetical protein